MTPGQKVLLDNFMYQHQLTATDIINYLTDRDAKKYFKNSVRVFEETVLEPRDLSS